MWKAGTTASTVVPARVTYHFMSLLKNKAPNVDITLKLLSDKKIERIKRKAYTTILVLLLYSQPSSNTALQNTLLLIHGLTFATLTRPPRATFAYPRVAPPLHPLSGPKTHPGGTTHLRITKKASPCSVSNVFWLIIAL